MRETDTAPATKKRENKSLQIHPKKSEPSSTSLSHSTVQSESRLSTPFKIYPEGDHFSAPPLLPPSFPHRITTASWLASLLYPLPGLFSSQHLERSSHTHVTPCAPSFHCSDLTLLWPPQRHCLSRTSQAYFSLKAFTLAVPLPRIPFAHIFTWLTLSPLLSVGPNERDRST